MLRMTFVENDPPTDLEIDMLYFVNKHIVDIITVSIEVYYDGSEDFIEPYFPRAYYKKNSEKCIDIVLALRDTIASEVIYNYLSPLYSYVLYHIIADWIEAYNDIPSFMKHTIPKKLKNRIYEHLRVPLNASKKDFHEELFLIKELENVRYYNMICFEDFDFLEEEIRHLVEYAIGGLLYLLGYTYEEIDEYIEVMPIDVAERYVSFRRKQQSIIKNNNENNIERGIIQVIEKVMRTFERRVVNHSKKFEVELTADLQEKIEDVIADKYNVMVTREFTLGRASKTIGETDLYFYIRDADGITDIAILENKNIENFKDQYLQLMGYLNSNFMFGITVSINRKYTILNAKEKIITTLENISGDFKAEKIYNTTTKSHYLVSEHIVPETNDKMRVYHFIMNLYDESRVKAALSARK